MTDITDFSPLIDVKPTGFQGLKFQGSPNTKETAYFCAGVLPHARTHERLAPLGGVVRGDLCDL